MTTFRAAYLIDETKTGCEVLLTDEDDQHLPDEELIDKALEQAEEAGLPGVTRDRIAIEDEWTLRTWRNLTR